MSTGARRRQSSIHASGRLLLWRSGTPLQDVRRFAFLLPDTTLEIRRRARRTGRAQRIDLSVTQKQVDESPSIEADRLVSRVMEAELSRYYGYPNCWGFGAAAPVRGWGALPELPSGYWRQ